MIYLCIFNLTSELLLLINYLRVIMKFNILYLDDEPENLRAFKSVFRREYNIYTTESPSLGLEYLIDNKVHLIITDQRMPEMTGVEFLKKVYDLKPDLPPNRMILSGYSRTEVIDEAKTKYKLSEFVAKPWDPEDLKIKMDKAIKECYN